MKKISSYIPLFAILALAGFIRFKTTPLLMTFTPDEAYQTYLAQTIIKDFHIIWIGMSAGSFGLFLGPLWIYFIVPFLMLSKGDPLTLGYLGSIFGLATIVIIYNLGQKMFNKKVAIIASLFYATLPLIIYYDQKPYPTGIPFLSTLMILALYFTKKSKYWWIVFSAAYAAVFNIHLSLLPIILVAIYWALKHKKTINKKIIAVCFLVFMLISTPLIMFDYFHKGSNISAPFMAFMSPHPSLLQVVPYHTKTFLDSLGRVWYLPPAKNSTDEILWPCTLTSSTVSHGLLIFSLISLLAISCFVLMKRNEKEEKKLLIALTTILTIPFIISSLINPIEYYLLGFFPILFLITAAVIDSSNKKIKPFLYSLVIIICLLGSISVLTAKKDYGLLTKEILINKVMKIIKDDPYSLYEEGGCHKYEGWRYLFATYARPPEQSSDDPIYGWLYKDELSKKTPKYRIIIKETRSTKTIDNSYSYSITEGGFTAYIYPIITLHLPNANSS